MDVTLAWMWLVEDNQTRVNFDWFFDAHHRLANQLTIWLSTPAFPIIQVGTRCIIHPNHRILSDQKQSWTSQERNAPQQQQQPPQSTSNGTGMGSSVKPAGQPTEPSADTGSQVSNEYSVPEYELKSYYYWGQQLIVLAFSLVISVQ